MVTRMGLKNALKPLLMPASIPMASPRIKDRIKPRTPRDIVAPIISKKSGDISRCHVLASVCSGDGSTKSEAITPEAIFQTPIKKRMESAVISLFLVVEAIIGNFSSNYVAIHFVKQLKVAIYLLFYIYSINVA